MRSFTTIPFLRIMIPFVAGIVFAIYCGKSAGISVLSLVMFIILVVHPLKTGTVQKKALLIIVDVFLFLYGSCIVRYTDKSGDTNHYMNFVPSDSIVDFIAVVGEIPEEKERSLKLCIEVIEILWDKQQITCNGRVYAYMKKSHSAFQIKHGAMLLIRGKFQEIAGPMNPQEFNYKKYLQNKQVFHTLFVDSTHLVKLNLNSTLNPVWEFGLNCKSYLLTKLKTCGLSQEAYAICAALLTGHDDDIEKPIMDAFSHSGTLHVLSVSGLHTGLIYLALNFLLQVIDPRQRFKLSRFLFITLFLWLFALLAGFSAPVLRAVIMFNLMGLGKIYFRNSFTNQMNILLVSAFLLLCYNPWWITDVGFLLSYFAMFGLFYFHPVISDLWHPNNALLNYCWQSTSSSLSATISTLPITLLIFKQFPLWFIVCNIVVIPVIFAVLFLLVPLLLNVSISSAVINLLITWMIRFIEIFDQKNSGFIDMIHFTGSDAAFFSLFLFFLSISLQYHSYLFANCTLWVLITWQSMALITSYVIKKENLFTVYQIKKQTGISVKSAGTVFIRRPDKRAYDYHVKPQLISLGNQVCVDTVYHYLALGNQRIVILDGATRVPTGLAPYVSTLVLSQNVRLWEDELRLFKNLRTVVCDGSNSLFSTRHTEKLCSKFALNFYDTKTKGAFLLTLK